MFVDTSGWIDIVQGEPNALGWLHLASDERREMGPAHTSDYVIAEAYSFIQRNHRRADALRFLDAATRSSIVLHPSDADLVDRAMAEARKRSFKHELSLIDWTSALLMRHHGIDHILTTDRGFAQLGFTVLP